MNNENNQSNYGRMVTVLLLIVIIAAGVFGYQKWLHNRRSESCKDWIVGSYELSMEGTPSYKECMIMRVTQTASKIFLGCLRQHI